MIDLSPIPVHSEELLRAAHHEAGHALLAVHFNRRVDRVIVRADGSGHVYCEKINPAHRRRDRARIAAEEIAIAAAGYIAEDRYAQSVRAERLKLDAWPFAVDCGNINYLFRVAPLNRDVYWPQLRRATTHIVKSAWPAVREIAARLLERGELSGGEVHELCRTAQSPANSSPNGAPK